MAAASGAPSGRERAPREWRMSMHATMVFLAPFLDRIRAGGEGGAQCCR